MTEPLVTDEQLAEWEGRAQRNQSLGVPSARDERILALLRALRDARAENEALREFAEWLVSLDDPADTWMLARQSVTLTAIIDRARTALAAPTGQEEDRG
jgi:hypothetical protein